MPSFHDPSRPRSASGLPEWLGHHSVLPHVDIAPSEAGGWLLDVMVPYKGKSYAWASCQLSNIGEVARVLVEWAADPEATLRTRFGHQLPVASEADEAEPEPLTGLLKSEASVDDLGL